MLGGGYKWLMNAIDEDHSRFFTPDTIEEARDRGVLVAELGAGVAKDWGGENQRQISEAWVHAESHAEYTLLFWRRLVLEDTTRLCFTLEGSDPDVIQAVGSTRSWWIEDASGVRFSASARLPGPVVYCRHLTGDPPEALHVTKVYQDSVVALAQTAVGVPLDSVGPDFKPTERATVASTVAFQPATFMGQDLLLTFEPGDQRRVLGVWPEPRASSNGTLLLQGCSAPSDPDAAALAEYDRRETRISRGWIVTHEEPMPTEVSPERVVCAEFSDPAE